MALGIKIYKEEKPFIQNGRLLNKEVIVIKDLTGATADQTIERLYNDGETRLHPDRYDEATTLTPIKDLKTHLVAGLNALKAAIATGNLFTFAESPIDLQWSMPLASFPVYLDADAFTEHIDILTSDFAAIADKGISFDPAIDLTKIKVFGEKPTTFEPTALRAFRKQNGYIADTQIWAITPSHPQGIVINYQTLDNETKEYVKTLNVKIDAAKKAPYDTAIDATITFINTIKQEA